MTIQDDTPLFLKFWRVAKNESNEARVARYKAEVIPTFPGFWDYFVATAGEAGADTLLGKRFSEFEAMDQKFQAAAARAPADLQVAISAMRKSFPDFDPKVDVRFIHSLGKMDGGGRVFRGKFYLLFGLDMMVKYHTWGDDRPFYAHELFHMYQAQRLGLDGRDPNPSESIQEEKVERGEPLYFFLWEEGLATYVSEWAFPGVSKVALTLDVPKGMIPNCDQNLGFLAQDLLAKLDSKQTKDYADYFYFSSKDPRRPGRAGYYIGYRIARSLHQRMPMNQLVSLRGDSLRKLMEDELLQLQRTQGSAANEAVR
jgi:hypothetical protein